MSNRKDKNFPLEEEQEPIDISKKDTKSRLLSLWSCNGIFCVIK